MSEVVAVVEGPTEQAFVRDVLAGHLAQRGVVTWAVLSGKSRKRGGVKGWLASREDIVRTLKEGRHCTTMFDFYGMPDDWPGRKAAGKLPPAERGACVEAQLRTAIAAELDDRFNPERFIPYVQLHEFEALLFADTEQLARVASASSQGPETPLTLRTKFDAILTEAGSPEAIDDGYETCPSRRIIGLAPAYRKPLHGSIVVQRIGLETLRAKCRHFAAWVARLEQVGS